MRKPLLWFVIVVVVIGGAGWKFGGVAPHGKKMAADMRPECPHHWDSLFVVRDAKGYKVDDQVSATTVASAGAAPAQFGFAQPNAITNVPEYHDCQRMREVSGGTVKYGSLIAVFAGDSLGSMDSTVFTTPRAVAEVFVTEPGGYAQLGIVNTFNCLVLQREKSTWRGWMVPVQREVQCDQAFSLAQLKPEFELQVVPSRPPAGVVVPAVARWDWDTKANQQYIGVRCADEWCEVGRKELTVSTPRSDKFTKGDYDEQQLAEFPADGPMRPGDNWGTVRPAADLKAAKDAGLLSYRGRWVHVADVSMTPEAGGYTKSDNYEGGGKLANIYLCRGGRLNCRPSLPYLFFERSCNRSPGDGEVWYAKVTRPSGPPKYFCVVYRAHKGVEIPPVVRWRWRVMDEGVWVSCPEGCCETNADTFDGT